MGKWAETEAAYFGGSDLQEEKETMNRRVLPILFNTDMVQAILEGRKTVTRRCVKLTRKDSIGFSVLFREGDDAFAGVVEIDEDDNTTLQTPPYQKEDTIYVRETWSFIQCIGCNGEYARGAQPCYDFQAVEYDDGDSISDGCFVYRADCKTPERIVWRPSIHMPKQAARIWLKVTDVRVERLQNITDKQAEAEGIHWDDCPAGYTWKSKTDIHNRYTNPIAAMAELWNGILTKDQKDRFGWSANPWVWVIEFERCKKPMEE